MILWKSKIETEDKPEFSELGRRSWRWVFEVDYWKPMAVGAGFYHQVLFEKGDWRPAVQYYNLSLTPHFRLGERHDYYDGPHCSFSIGFLHINWSGDWCKKCMPDDEVECATS